MIAPSPPPSPTRERHYDEVRTKIDMWLTPYCLVQESSLDDS